MQSKLRYTFNGSANFSFEVAATELYSNETLIIATITILITDCGPHPSQDSYACYQNGLCIDDGNPFDGKYHCVCQKTFGGTHCNVSVISDSSNSEDQTLLLALLLTFGFFVLVALVLRNRHLNRKRAAETGHLRERLLKQDTELSEMRKVWDIAWEDVKLGETLGNGAFGMVSRAVWRETQTVAVKTVNNIFVVLESATVSSEMQKEIEFLQSVRHPNIVHFFGAGKTPEGTPFLVLELVDRGTLTNYLQSEPYISWDLKVNFAWDAAKGMAHVHSLNRVHLDLKSMNLLLSSTLRVKIADFGTAKMNAQEPVKTSLVKDEVTTMSSKSVGTLAWMVLSLFMLFCSLLVLYC